MADTNILIVGGGPAGLATAIAARKAGFSVAVADRAKPPIDKACGEGIMPDGLAALEAIGVRIPAGRAFAFRGIRFLENDVKVESAFAKGSGLGMRRTVLHDLLVTEAEAAGVRLYWGAQVAELSSSAARVDGRWMSFDWIVGADGQGSRVRQHFGLDKGTTQPMRFGFRKHFALTPWSDLVEVYWANCGQVYVTPVADNEVCVAMITQDPRVRLSALAAKFPALARRLEQAGENSREQGAVTVIRSLERVTAGGAALVGEASGSVDAITGEGMSLAFQQARALVAALQRGSLMDYEAAHKKMLRNPRRMAKMMLALGRSKRVRDRVLQALSSHPEVFAEMLKVHVGQSTMREFGLQRAMRLGWCILTA